MSVDTIIQFGALAGAITAIGSLFVWLYNKLVKEPDRKLEEKLSHESNRALEKTVEPLTYEIKKLNHLLNESQSDRKNLHAQDDKQNVVLENHETRISVLEDWRSNKRRN